MSKVKEVAKALLEMAENSLPDKFSDQRVTVRLSGLQFGALLVLASRFAGTATGTAQELLGAAIEDALIEIGYPSFEGALPDIVSALERDERFQAEFTIKTPEVG